MTRDRLKYAACQSAGYLDGSRESRVAQVAMDAALDNWMAPMPEVAAQARREGDFLGDDRQLRKIRKREERDLYRSTKAKTIATIQANPQAYGFGPIAVWLIWFIVGKIVERIVEWLMKRRYEGGDSEIQAAIGASK